MRSFLFVPADSERKLAKAVDVAADALILDLEDAVVPEARPRARELAAGDSLAISSIRDFEDVHEVVWEAISTE